MTEGQRIAVGHFIVRKAIPYDAKAVAQLYQRNFPEHIMVQRGFLNDTGYLRERFVDPNEEWVVSENGSIAGVAALAIIPPVGLGEIERVCVSAEHRRNGAAVAMCAALVEQARKRDLGFVEAYARGDQQGMQRAFENVGFKVYGISPRFEIVHNGRVCREQFVHMGLELKPETVDESAISLIPAAKAMYAAVYKQ